MGQQPFPFTPRGHRYGPQTSPHRRSLRQAWAGYFRPTLWRSLLQYMTSRGDWQQAAALAYGLQGCLLLAFFTLLAAASLFPEIHSSLSEGLTYWRSSRVTEMHALLEQSLTDWQLSHRWLLLVLSGGTGLSLWLKGIGRVQQIFREGNRRPRSLRQRLGTTALAIACAVLLLLAWGFAFAVLPAAEVAPPRQELLSGALRWSLSLSTVALMFGVFYRFSPGPRPRASQAILPGTVLATGLWVIPPILLKTQVEPLIQAHWLFGGAGAIALLQVGTYSTVLAVLAGGAFNFLATHPTGGQPSQQPPSPPPPSFESFTIQRRP